MGKKLEETVAVQHGEAAAAFAITVCRGVGMECPDVDIALRTAMQYAKMALTDEDEFI